MARPTSFRSCRAVYVSGIEKVNAEFEGDEWSDRYRHRGRSRTRHSHTAQSEGGDGRATAPSLRVFMSTLERLCSRD
jgi:hypothetical protein